VELQLGHFIGEIIYHKKQIISMKSVLILKNPRPTMQAKFVFFLALIFSGAQTKIVIQTETPGADVYLDGNFVAKTDEHGSLPIENLPPGLFRFSIKKDGYLPYDGSFQITEGESKNVQVSMRQIETPQDSAMPLPVRTALPDRKASSPNNSLAITPKPKQSMTEAAANRLPGKIVQQAVPIAPAPEEAKVANDRGSSAILIISIALTVLLAAGFLIFVRRTARMRTELPQSEPPPMEGELAGIPAPRIKQSPEFVDELKRREELIQARFLSIKANERDPGKDVVIVLPKEDYSSEEE
jgi:hypothetical protein